MNIFYKFFLKCILKKNPAVKYIKFNLIIGLIFFFVGIYFIIENDNITQVFFLQRYLWNFSKNCLNKK